MTAMIFTIEPDEFPGWSPPLVELDRAADGGNAGTVPGAGAASTAKTPTRTALADSWKKPACHGSRPRK